MVNHSKQFRTTPPQHPIKPNDFITSCQEEIDWTPFPVVLDFASLPVPQKFKPADPALPTTLTCINITLNVPYKLYHILQDTPHPSPSLNSPRSARVKFTVFSPSTTAYKPILASILTSTTTLLADLIAAIPCKTGKFGNVPLDKSCYLFISGVFYGEVVSVPLGTVSKSIEGVTVGDVGLAVGVYYLYSHSGCCEHGKSNCI